jgi:hypothetical protein
VLTCVAPHPRRPWSRCGRPRRGRRVRANVLSRRGQPTTGDGTTGSTGLVEGALCALLEGSVEEEGPMPPLFRASCVARHGGAMRWRVNKRRHAEQRPSGGEQGGRDHSSAGLVSPSGDRGRQAVDKSFVRPLGCFSAIGGACAARERRIRDSEGRAAGPTE